jgi:hypothetical protein
MAKQINYVSDTTQFVRDLLAQRPHLVEEQRKARARWWDKQLDLTEEQKLAEAKVRQQAYVYQTKV